MEFIYSKSARQLLIPLVVCLLALSTVVNAASVRAEAAISSEIPVPTGLRVAVDDEHGVPLVTHNSITITWEQAPGYDDPYDPGYYVRYKDAAGNGAGFWANGAVPAVIRNLQPATEYTVSVELNLVGAPATSIKVATLEGEELYEPAPLTPPANLSVTDATYNSLTFGWTGSPGAEGYDFYVNGGWAGGIWDGSNRYTFTIPEEETVTGITYTFQVAAQNLPDVSEGSNTVEITWGELIAPQDMQVVTATRSTVSLGWAPVPGATGYDVYQDGELIGTTEENRYVVAGLTEGEAYTFTAVAHNAVWQSPESDSVTAVPGSQYNIVTYYTSWSVYARDFQPEDIDVSEITHINYAFADLCWLKFGTGSKPCENENLPLQDRYVHDGEIVIGDAEADPGNFAKFAEIKQNNPHLKLIISVGGWSWSKNFSNMAAEEETRRAFANSVVNFLREYKLDGVDIDWEYPVEGGEAHNSHSPEDKENFTLLMHTVREALDAAGSEDGSYYLLTIASGQGDNFVVNADLADSTEFLDFVNIMTYDYSGSWETMAHANSPLYYDSRHPSDSAERNNAFGGLNGHLNGGVPAYKLVMGIPFYGKGWSGCPEAGQYDSCAGATPFGTWENGAFDFSDIENHYIGRNGYVRHWNEASKTPYLYNADEQIYLTYNDQDSMKYAASIVKTLDLAGVMSWEVSGDRNRTLSGELADRLRIDGSVDEEALNGPEKLKAGYVGRSSVQLVWNAVEGATGYEVYKGNRYVAATTGLDYTVTGLKPSTSYDLRVLAVQLDGEAIAEVSPAAAIRVTTDKQTSSGSGGNGGGTTGTPETEAGNVLKTKESMKDGVRTVEVQTEAALATIEASDSDTFIVKADEASGTTAIIVPREVIDAIAEKGKEASLSVYAGGIVYTIPAHAIRLSAQIRIVIGPPSAGLADAFAAVNEYELLAQPVEVKLEKETADGQYEAVGEIGEYIRLAFAFDGDGVETGRAAGVVYSPATNELRPVPATFTVNKDGTVTAELKRKGNSIYAVVQTGASSFSDTIGTWADESVRIAVSKLIVKGDSAETFGANRAVTRAEFASMIVRGLGIVPLARDPQFADVGPQSAYAADIAAAKRAGLVQGKSETAFDPDGTLTRQEQAAILVNAMRYAGFAGAADPSVLSRFADRSDIAPFAEEHLAVIVEQGIMKGVSDTSLAPRGTVTKAQAAVTVVRMLQALDLIE